MGHMPTPPAPQPLPGVANIIAIGSGKGGVGKTTLSVNVAVALSKLGYRVGLIDADIYGPNVPLMLGSSAQPRVKENNQIEPNTAHGIKVISIGFISSGRQAAGNARSHAPPDYSSIPAASGLG